MLGRGSGSRRGGRGEESVDDEIVKRCEGGESGGEGTSVRRSRVGKETDIQGELRLREEEDSGGRRREGHGEVGREGRRRRGRAGRTGGSAAHYFCSLTSIG